MTVSKYNFSVVVKQNGKDDVFEVDMEISLIGAE